MSTLYVYSNESNVVVAKISGETMAACEAKADSEYGSNDYSWTASPALGCVDGLVDDGTARELKADGE